MSEQTEEREILRAKLNQETAKAGWGELLPFFARGQTVSVATGLDLIDVALAFSEDNAGQITLWKEKGLVDKVTDEQAAQWYESDQTLWTVVVMPWVLVQPEQLQ
ncbi:MAG: DUF2288 domain-containing protein [Alcanivorax nanhaiticus]